MSYTQVSFRVDPLEPWRDILIFELGELGFESFEENQDGLNAYIPTEQFDRKLLNGLVSPHDPHTSIDWVVRELQDENWNARWEESFKPVQVGRQVLIRAEHHPPSEVEHDIIIHPRMAFGTGHHATTYMMIEGMLDLDFEGRTVCDMGCGTAVLAILAERLGAESVLAIDNDDNAVDNAKVNLARNGCERVTVEKGVIDNLVGHNTDIILANIQRNVLSEGMPTLASNLNAEGHLLLSGFILDDVDYMTSIVEEYGLQVTSVLKHGDWAMITCGK